MLSYADAQYGLFQSADGAIEPMLPQIFHSGACLSLPRKNDTVCIGKLLWVVCEGGGDCQTFECINNRTDVSSVVFHYGYFHLLFLWFCQLKMTVLLW